MESGLFSVFFRMLSYKFRVIEIVDLHRLADLRQSLRCLSTGSL